jgi:Pro-kumamolisin, activation domain
MTSRVFPLTGGGLRGLSAFPRDTQPNSVVIRDGTLLALIFVSLLSSLAASQQIGIPAQTKQAIDERKLTVLKGNTHPLARAEFDRGPAPSDLPLNRMLLVLQRSSEQEASLKAMLNQQQDKSTPNYHAWLTPAQFGQQFGPSEQDIQTVTLWLESHGFHISRVSNGRITIEFSGTAVQVEEAFPHGNP